MPLPMIWPDMAALNVWADKIKEWLKQYDVYVYFNNDIGGYAITNSVELRNILTAQH
jgi:uncharacterized protein YecE (DUF72 family)